MRRLLNLPVREPASLVMERKMLIGIEGRVERHRRHAFASVCREPPPDIAARIPEDAEEAKDQQD